tara:strand:+ start:4461 stop:6677 length:2217 start_codon:yes stop_codon:yes gene_type:complete
MADPTRTSPLDIEISSLVLEKPDGKTLTVLPGAGEENEGEGVERLFGSLTITEGIFASGMRGNLKLNDPALLGTEFNLVGNEKIIIEMKTPGIEDSDHELTFCVYDLHYLGDDTVDQLKGPSQRVGSIWSIDFVTCENYFLNWSELDYMNEDFIGKIAGSEGGLFGIGSDPGLVDVLAEKYFNPGTTPFSHAKNPMDIEPTHNSIWLKSNQNMYPWGKDVNPPNLMNLMNSVAENAVTEDLIGMNYLFYQDFDGWHFKSVNKLIDESTTDWLFGLVSEDNKRQYTISDVDDADGQESNDRIIQKMVVTNEYNHMQMWEKGAYSSYYELVKPNYEDPYFEYMDSVSRHQKSKLNQDGNEDDEMFWGKRDIITYDYHRDAEEWPKIAKYKLLADDIDTSIDVENIHNGKGRRAVRKYDETGMWGYFSSLYNNPQETPLDYLGSRNTNGKYGKTNDMVWQAMFDQSNLSAETLKEIQEKIKLPLRSPESASLAESIINPIGTAVDSLIGDGLSPYEEYVQMLNLKAKWNVYRNTVCCDKKTNVPYQFLAVIENARQVQENDRAGIFEYTWREVEIWPKKFVENLDDDEIEVLSEEDSPIAIVVVKGGGSGEVMEEEQEEWTNPAYNINELFNSEDEENNIYAGPGINVADDEYNDYPESYRMMPVGGYFKVDVDPCTLEDPADVYYHRHIVQMYRMPGKVLHGGVEITPRFDEDGNEDTSVPDEFYFFDVPNAHDGLCGCR